MKKVIDVNIGRINFSIEEDAYSKLEKYLKNFEASIENKDEASEVMEDIEIRVAELFQREVKYQNQVIDQNLVQSVIERLGEPESIEYRESNSKNEYKSEEDMETNRKFYRNTEDKKVAGVCSGIAAYFKLDVTLIRIIFILLVVLGIGSPILIYIVLWIVMPKAKTTSQKLEMFGISPTAENIRNYPNHSEKNK